MILLNYGVIIVEGASQNAICLGQACSALSPLDPVHGLYIMSSSDSFFFFFFFYGETREKPCYACIGSSMGSM